MMIEAEQRMLTKRPTVPRTSEIGIWLCANSPTRASEPRTEITRPKEVTDIPGCLETKFDCHYAGWSLHKMLSPRNRESLKSAAFWFVEPRRFGCPRNDLLEY